jgi:Rrf2 family protein
MAARIATPRLLTRRDLLAITAVLDIALNARGRPVSAPALAARHGLAPRHLEPVLQELVRHGILKGIRGPRGGYELARERRRITAVDILLAARPDDAKETERASEPDLLHDVVAPALAEAERELHAALAAITLDALVRRATARGIDASIDADFTI